MNKLIINNEEIELSEKDINDLKRCIEIAWSEGIGEVRYELAKFLKIKLLTDFYDEHPSYKKEI